MTSPRAEPLWGRETDKAIANFAISGEPMPPGVIRALAAIKAAAARANADLGVLPRNVADAIAAAADRVAGGEYADQFPVDVFQTGSGTSTNMNVNEVVAALAGEGVHPNDHVNAGQSSNDTVPAAVQLAVLASIHAELLPSVTTLIGSLRGLAERHANAIRPGRTHLMDAVPVLWSQTCEAWTSQLDEAAEQIAATRLPLARLPLGGTAVGNGLAAHRQLATRVVAELDMSRRFGVTLELPRSRSARMGAHDALVGTSGALVVLATALTKIANDLRWMASGPATGLAEITLPALQKGSSIMPGKVNPVIPEVVLQVAAQVIGNHTTVTVAGMQGNFELNVMVPVMARNVLQSIALLANGCAALAERCVDGVEVDETRSRALAARSPALATALNPLLGYEAVEAIVRESVSSGRAIADVAREVAQGRGVDRDAVDATLDLDRIARGPAH
jgi:fumarate hydratase, class II